MIFRSYKLPCFFIRVHWCICCIDSNSRHINVINNNDNNNTILSYFTVSIVVTVTAIRILADTNQA